MKTVMKRVTKWSGVAVLVVIVLAAVVVTWLVNARPDLSVFEDRYAPPAKSDVTVRFFGTSSMLFADGETNVMIDGWFTRPSTTTLVFGKVEPDIAAIEDGLDRLGNPKIAALLVVHSHLDHALDVAEVAKRTEALLVGSESTANIGRGGGLPENQIKVVQDGEKLQFGDFTVTMIESRHFVAPSAALQEDDPFIRRPLTPPAAGWDYREGRTYSVLIEHPAGSALIQASAGFKEGSLEGLDVDTVYLGVGFLASQTAEYQETYWDEVVTLTQPESIYLIHWDSYSRPIADLDNRPVAPNRLWNDLFGMRSDEGIEFALGRAEQAGISATLLPMWDEVDAFAVIRLARSTTQ